MKKNSEDLIKALAEIVGPQYVTNEIFVLMTYTQDFGAMPPQWPDVVVRPGDTEETSKILKLANKFKVPVVPRGGGSAQEGGCIPSRGGIVLETTRMNRILDINEDCGTVTVEAGICFGKLISALEKRGWKIGIMPSGALGGTVGAHVSRPGVGWGNIKYSCQGDQVIGLKVVLPTGSIISTGTGASPTSGQFFRYALGPDLTGLFVGSEGSFGVITEATLKIYPFPEEIYLERFTIPKLSDAISVFREICHRRLAVYISCLEVAPKIVFDINVEGDREEVSYRKKAIWKIIEKANGHSLGSEEPKKFWEYRFFNTGKEFKHGTAGPVNYWLPFSKLEEATNVMRGIMKKHKIKRYSTEMFPLPTCSEHVNLMFYHQDDTEEYQKIREAMKEMMKKALQIGGTPYTKGKQWGPYIAEHLKNTTYWKTLKAIKKLLDPNGIMNPDVVGI